MSFFSPIRSWVLGHFNAARSWTHEARQWGMHFVSRFDPAQKTASFSASILAVLASVLGAEPAPLPTAMKNPHLILHVDVNGTLILTDKASGKSIEKALIYALASKVEGCWDKAHLHAPMTYTDYVKFKKLPKWPHETTDRITARKIQDDQKELICEFFDYLHANDHSALPEAKQLYNRALKRVEEMREKQSHVFPSFYALLNYLKTHEISYTLVLRTFGKDGELAAKEISQRLGDVPVEFRHCKGRELVTTEGGSEDFYRFINGKKNSIILIQDDWDTWFQSKESQKLGKPFPFEESRSDSISLFFDDNAYSVADFPDWGIVSPYHAHDQRDSPIEEAQDRILPVKTVDALILDDYYIQFVEKVLSQNRTGDAAVDA